MDLNQDGELEIIVQTFGARLFVYNVPGSAENMLLWPTGRGNYLRDGRSWLAANDLRINNDISGDGLVDLRDVVAALKIVGGTGSDQGYSSEAAADGQIGSDEAISLLRLLSR